MTDKEKISKALDIAPMLWHGAVRGLCGRVFAADGRHGAGAEEGKAMSEKSSRAAQAHDWRRDPSHLSDMKCSKCSAVRSLVRNGHTSEWLYVYSNFGKKGFYYKEPECRQGAIA